MCVQVFPLHLPEKSRMQFKKKAIVSIMLYIPIAHSGLLVFFFNCNIVKN